jgi:valyl-tRNA synthetase
MEWVKFLIRAENVEIGKSLAKPAGSAASAVILGYESDLDKKRVDIFVPISKYVDLTKEKERIEKEIKKIELELERAKKKLSNRNFTDKAPVAVVEKEREKLVKYEELSRKLRENLENLS